MVEEANFQKSKNEIFELWTKEKRPFKKQGCLNASFSSGECYNFRRVASYTQEQVTTPRFISLKSLLITLNLYTLRK